MKQFAIRSPLFIALTLFFLCTSMQAPTSGPTLKGQLVDQETFDVVKNATIRLTQGEEEHLIISNKEGKFDVHGIPAGIYKVRIQKEGYKAVYFDFFEVYPAQPSYLIARMRSINPSYSARN